ncbi:uncharacterized protein [Cherax quadricarinatus]|uniref:uncharacterized protein isoform X2 n=1 Tax=Cherax quadricarinatus TaxID=27406 RepID=UPI002378591D|nr:uncharacterized protein LOC128704633 isoform X2 [Cherax quadricarinatus]
MMASIILLVVAVPTLAYASFLPNDALDGRGNLNPTISNPFLLSTSRNPFPPSPAVHAPQQVPTQDVFPQEPAQDLFLQYTAPVQQIPLQPQLPQQPLFIPPQEFPQQQIPLQLQQTVQQAFPQIPLQVFSQSPTEQASQIASSQHASRFPPSRCDPIAKPLVDEIQDGRAYHFSWCHDGGLAYTWEHAVNYCAALRNGFQAISIESRREQNFVSNILLAYNVADSWTSGNKFSTYWQWLSGISSSYTNWSVTGRLGLPQPDNEEGNELCLAVLNNRYNDGVTWHDLNCLSLTPVICETAVFYN